MPGPALAVLAVMSPDEVNACVSKASSACLVIFRRFHNDVVARAADWLIARPLRDPADLFSLCPGCWLVNRGRSVGSSAASSTSSEAGAPGCGGVGPDRLRHGDPAGLRSVSGPTSGPRRWRWCCAAFRPVGGARAIAGADDPGRARPQPRPALGRRRDRRGGRRVRLADARAGLPLGHVHAHRGPVRRGRRDRRRRRSSGVVEGLSLRTTRLRDVEGVVWHIPNGEIPSHRQQVPRTGHGPCST